MATLHFHYGVMGSAKTSNLMDNVGNWRRSGHKVEVIKPETDTRYKYIKSRNRADELEADIKKTLVDYVPEKRTKFVVVDEIQFFTPADVDRLVYIADNYKNITIMCYGLMVDSNEQMFPASKRLLEVGAKLHYHDMCCQIRNCKNPATHQLRFDAAGNVVRNGDQVCVGMSNYKSVCRMHYNKLYHDYCEQVHRNQCKQAGHGSR